MRISSVFTAILGSAAFASALVIPRHIDTASVTGFSKVRPGGVKDLIVSKETTLNGTYKGDARTVLLPGGNGTTASLPFRFVNNFGGEINAYMTGLDPSGAVCFVRRDGSLAYPSSGGSSTPVQVSQDVKITLAANQTLDMTLPTSLKSGRVYFAAGELRFAVVATPIGDGIVQPAPNNPSDPSAGVNWGFVELTLLENGTVYVNISYVDFVGMPLGIELAVKGGSTQSAYGVSGNAVSAVCNDLRAQSSVDGRPWSGLCMVGDSGPIRALSPNGYSSIDNRRFRTYWDDYVNQVWAKYTHKPLVIDTQNTPGRVKCQVSGDVLHCDGDNRGYNKPTAKDIWGCNSGPFSTRPDDNAVHLAVVPRLCAAFVRSTLLLDGGDVQPSLGQDKYYTVNPTNHYSRIVHTHEVDGKGYAFAYDDVNPTGNENASGTLSSATPNTLTVFVGSPPT